MSDPKSAIDDVIAGRSRHAVVCGDVMDVLPLVPDASAHVSYNDPPYGLSEQTTENIVECLRAWLDSKVYTHTSGRERKQDCAANVLRRASVRHADDPHPDTRESGVSGCVAGSSDVGMVRIAVEFDDHFQIRKEKVDYENVCVGLDDLLVDEVDSDLDETVSYAEFAFRPRQGLTACVGDCACATKSHDSFVRVDVWLRDYPETEAERATGVVALSGAERRAVLAYDLRRASARILPAEGACDDRRSFVLLPTQGVGALGRARRLASELQSPGRSDVRFPADGALPIDAVVDSSIGPRALAGTPNNASLRCVEKPTARYAILLHSEFYSRLTNPIKKIGGMMGAEWDSFVPGPEAWREVNRVLKPGGYNVSFSSTRTVDLLGMAIRLAGFELRQGWSWIQGQGFPKSLDVSKAIDAASGAEREVAGPRVRVDGKAPGKVSGGKHGIFGEFGDLPTTITAPATETAKQWDGYGTDVKPAYEPLVVARKEMDGTVAANVLAHGCGVLNIDAARIQSSETLTGGGGKLWSHYRDGTEDTAKARVNDGKGRFPAALALVHDEDCELVGVTKAPATSIHGSSEITRRSGAHEDAKGHQTVGRVQPLHGYADADGTETVDEWRCTETCAVAELARQSGASRSNVGKPREGKSGDGWGMTATGAEYDDQGSAARFFYQAKASASDRLAYVTCSENCAHHESVAGVREARSTASEPTKEQPHGLCIACSAPRTHYQHPTVKPQSLANWHAKLLSLPEHVSPIAIVPYCGTGIEAKALLDAGFRVIAIDIDPRHCAMTEFRLSNGAPVEARVTSDASPQPVQSKRVAAPKKPAASTSQLDLFGKKQ